LPPAVAHFVFPVPERRAVGVSFRNIALSPSGNELQDSVVPNEVDARPRHEHGESRKH